MKDNRPGSETTPEDVRAFHIWMLGTVVLAFLVRLVYLAQVEPMPLFYDLIGDGAAYWAWAGRIASGDGLGSEVFYQTPAYPCFLALLRLVTGADLWWAHVLQAAVGSMACGLLALAGRSFFSPRAGLGTGVLTALYAPAIFFDGLIQKATLSLFFMALLLWVLGRMSQGREQRRRNLIRAILAGVVAGLLALTQEQALLLVGVVLVWLLRGGAGRRLTAPCFLAGTATVLGLVAWRNYEVGGEVALTTVQAGPNFYIGNHEGATGRYLAMRPGAEWPPLERQAATELAEAELGYPLTPGQVSRYWLGKSWDYVRRHPWDWLALLAHKWALVWNAYELSDTESFRLYAHLSWLLGVLGKVNHFGVLWPLAVAGVVATVRRRRDLWLLYALALAIAGGVALFYVFARYRYPLVPVLALFAGAGVVALARTVRRVAARFSGPTSETPRGGERRASLTPGGGGTVPEPSGRMVPGPWSNPRAVTLGYVGPPAVRPSHAAIMVVFVMLVAATSNLRFEHQRFLDGTAYENWGEVMAAKGNHAAAVYLLTEALRHCPESARLHLRLGEVLAAQGQADDEALSHLNQAVHIDSGQARAHFNLGLLHARSGRFEEALESYRRALGLEPANPAAHYNIGAILDHQGHNAEAVAEYRTALEIDPHYAKARHALAWYGSGTPSSSPASSTADP